MFYDTFKWGFEHILDPDAYDHLLFIVALCAVYRLKDWKKVILLATAFTIGHCLTLFLSGLDYIRINSELVEFLIPITIIITAIENMISYNKTIISQRLKYVICLGFGLIHGLGFSNNFRTLLGENDSIIGMLLPFNLGIEAGQIVIIAGCLLFSWIYEKTKLEHKYWVFSLSIIAIMVSIYLLV